MVVACPTLGAPIVISIVRQDFASFLDFIEDLDDIFVTLSWDHLDVEFGAGVVDISC